MNSTVHEFNGWSCSNKYFLQLDLNLNRETPVTFYVFGNLIKIITHMNKKEFARILVLAKGVVILSLFLVWL